MGLSDLLGRGCQVTVEVGVEVAPAAAAVLLADCWEPSWRMARPAAANC